MSKNSMLVLLQIALFFSCSYAQEEEIFDQDDNIFLGDNLMDLSSGSGEEPSSEISNNNLEENLRELSALLNNDLRQAISNIQADMKEMKNEMSKITENIVGNEVKIERNSAQITSVSEQQETMIVNNIQRLNFMDNKMADIMVKMDEISINSDKISHMNSTVSDVHLRVGRHSALMTSVSEEVEQQQAEMVDIKEKMANLEEEVVQNSDTIVELNSTAERNSAQITSAAETRIADNNQTSSDIEDMKDKIVKNSDKISDVNSTLNAHLSSPLESVSENEELKEEISALKTKLTVYVVISSSGGAATKVGGVLGQFEFNPAKRMYVQTSTEQSYEKFQTVYLYQDEEDKWSVNVTQSKKDSWLMRSTSASKIPPSSGWQYWDGESWNDDLSLTVTTGPLPPLPRQFTVTATAAISSIQPSSLGVFTKTQRWWLGRPVYVNKEGRLLHHGHRDSGWMIGDKLNFYVLKGSRARHSPANEDAWRYWTGSKTRPASVTITGKD